MGAIVSPSLLDGNFHKILPSWNTNGVLSSPETLTERLQHEQTSAVALADPRIDDRPQLGSKTEWYYFQAHLTSEISDEPLHTVFVCIFRHSPDGDKGHCWAVVYAVLDWRTQKYAAYSKVPNGVPAGVARMMETSHPRLSSIIQDLVDTGPSTDGTPFLPDTPFTSNVEIRQSEGPALQLDWDNGAFIVGENGSYHLKVPEIELDIQLQATRPVMLHGYDGVTCKDDTVFLGPHTLSKILNTDLIAQNVLLQLATHRSGGTIPGDPGRWHCLGRPRVLLGRTGEPEKPRCPNSRLELVFSGH